MQIERKDYNPDEHIILKALCVKQPYADWLTQTAFLDDAGFHAAKTIEVRSRSCNYRGDIVICSSAKPVIPGRISGAMLGIVELYDVKPISEFTESDWAATCIPEKDRPQKGYGWMMRNPRRIVEMPVKGQLGVYNLIVPKDDVTEYPRHMALGDDGWKMIQDKLK